jgi:hypothetical protein
MSRHDDRRFKRFVRLVKPYALQLSAWAATLNSPPSDPMDAARLYEKKMGVKPPVPWEVLPHILRFNTRVPTPKTPRGLPVPTYKPPT